MLPISSNTADQGCSPVSSNCVIWPGPNLSCIKLCKGDTVSDVVYKLATEVCALSGNLGLSDLDLSQLVQVCTTTVEPAKTLAAVLDLLIDKVVCLADLVDAIVPGGATYTEPTLNLPACLQYTNSQGQTVTQLIHNQYTLTLATKLCEIKSTVDLHTSQISGVSNRVTVLEAKTTPTLPTLAVQCLNGSATALDLDDALDVVADELCALKGVLGTNTAITAAAAKQCVSLGSLPALNATGTMSSIAGWKPTVTTLSDSIFNLWLTVCDMRGSIAGIKETVGTVDCTSAIIDFVASLNTARTSLTINFNGLTSYKGVLGLAGFSDCSLAGSTLTVKDSAGKKYITNLAIVSNATNSSGVTVSIPTGSGANELNATLNYTVTLQTCISNSGTNCQRTIEKTLFAPCTNITIGSVTIS